MRILFDLGVKLELHVLLWPVPVVTSSALASVLGPLRVAKFERAWPVIIGDGQIVDFSDQVINK